MTATSGRAQTIGPRQTAVFVAGVLALSSCAGAESAADTDAASTAPNPPAASPSAPAPGSTVGSAVAALSVPGTCPDPALWDTRAIANLLVVPGIGGGADWPPWLPPSTGGVFVGSQSSGLAAGLFTVPPKGAAIDPFVAVDYEGGLVSQHADVIGELPSPRAQSATMSVAEIQAQATERGLAMGEVGISVDFAPVVDLDLGSPIVGSRSYGSDVAVVVGNAGAFAAGLQAAEVVPTLKHFPGHGSTAGDSHETLAIAEQWEVLIGRDVEVFRQLLTRPGPWLVMMGHIVVPGLSTDAASPASVDPAAYRALRDTTGFRGPVITDDLSDMRAITDRLSAPEAVVSAISAGADLSLLSDARAHDEAITALTVWADGDPTGRAHLIAAATRAMQVMPCGTGWSAS